MRTFPLLALLLALPALASGPGERPAPNPGEKEERAAWPQKGDEVFIHATFLWKEERWVTKEGTNLPQKQTRELTREGCAGLVFGKRDKWRPLLLVYADDDHPILLCGDWTRAIFRTEEECRKAHHIGGVVVRPGKCLSLGKKEADDTDDQ